MPVILRSQLRRRTFSARSALRLTRDLDRAMRRLGVGDFELSVSIVGARAMRSANRRFFGKSTPTDVISISQLENGARGARSARKIAMEEKWLGDVIVSFDAAVSQAAEEGHSLQTELSILAVHGLLHNLGMDDQTPRKRRAMMRKTLRILR